MKLKSKKSQPGGFSLVEFLTVITILSVMGAFACGFYFDSNSSEIRKSIRADAWHIGDEENMVLWDYRQKIPAGWHIAHPPTMMAYVRERFKKDADRVWIIDPTEVSTFKDHLDAIVHVDVRNIVTPEDKAIGVYMMSADGERVLQSYGVGLTGATLIERIERDSEK